jgi:hydroxyacylglutathione hydrolase
MRVEAVPCLSDNYAYLIIDERNEQVSIVDASEPAPVLAAIARVGLPLAAILSTHHHGDHVGGNEDVIDKHPNAQVFGHRSEEKRIPKITKLLDDGEKFALGSLEIVARHVPGHTLGAVTFVVKESGDADASHAYAFTGDTLFLGGCGRLFEGTPEMMHRSLNHVLAQLPPETLVACGHEYTAANLKFAKHVEPDNAHIAKRAAEVDALRAEGKFTVPGTIAMELETNPFMRVEAPAVRTHVGLGQNADPVEVLRRLREEKNSFR